MLQLKIFSCNHEQCASCLDIRQGQDDLENPWGTTPATRNPQRSFAPGIFAGTCEAENNKLVVF